MSNLEKAFLCLGALGLFFLGVFLGNHNAEFKVTEQQSAIIRTSSMDLNLKPHKRYVLIVKELED